MGVRYTVAVCLVLLLAGLGAGCVSNTSGSPALTAENVKRINKGVTTRAQVEAIFGPPANLTMLSDGKRSDRKSVV